MENQQTSISKSEKEITLEFLQNEYDKLYAILGKTTLTQDFANKINTVKAAIEYLKTGSITMQFTVKS